MDELKQTVSDTKLVPKITITNNTSEIFCVKFTADGKFLAAGCGDGAIRVFNTENGHLAYNLQAGSNASLPTTALRFRPVTETSRTKNVFVATNAAGTIQHWHMSSAKCLHSMDEEEGNQIYALDFNDDGTKFATGGKDTAVRVYDEATKTKLVTMRGSSLQQQASPGHSNRIFSCKWVPGDEHMIASGGWDNTIQIWDIRTGYSAMNIYGAHICGDSLDVVGTEVLTGSWRLDNQLELWDIRTGGKLSDIPWHSSPFAAAGQPACMLYAAQFSKEGSGKYIAAGGSNANEAKLFDHSNNNAVVGTITGLSRGVFGVDISSDNKLFAIAGGDASVRILEIV